MAFSLKGTDGYSKRCVRPTELPAAASEKHPDKRGEAARSLTTAGQQRGITRPRVLHISFVTPLRLSTCEHCWTSTPRRESGMVLRTPSKAGEMKNESFRGCQPGARAGWKSRAEGQGDTPARAFRGTEVSGPSQQLPGPPGCCQESALLCQGGLQLLWGVTNKCANCISAGFRLSLALCRWLMQLSPSCMAFRSPGLNKRNCTLWGWAGSTFNQAKRTNWRVKWAGRKQVLWRKLSSSFSFKTEEVQLRFQFRMCHLYFTTCNALNICISCRHTRRFDSHLLSYPSSCQM